MFIKPILVCLFYSNIGVMLLYKFIAIFLCHSGTEQVVPQQQCDRYVQSLCKGLLQIGSFKEIH